MELCEFDQLEEIKELIKKNDRDQMRKYLWSLVNTIEEEMIEDYICPECGGEIIRKETYPETRIDPASGVYKCENCG